MPNSEAWRKRAACLGMATRAYDPWYPDRGDTAFALRICRECPVIKPCRRWAESLPDRRKYVGLVAGGKVYGFGSKGKRREVSR